MERAYQRDGIKDEDLKILLEHLDLAILSVGLLSYLNQYISLNLVEFLSFAIKRILMDVWPSFLYQMPIKGSSVALSAQKKSILPSSPLTLPLFWENFFFCLALGSNRRCHCISLTFSANFSYSGMALIQAYSIFLSLMFFFPQSFGR